MLYIPEILKHTVMRGLQPRRTGENIKRLSTCITRSLNIAKKNGLSYHTNQPAVRVSFAISSTFGREWRKETPNEESIKTTGSLSKPRRRRQRERHQTKGLMSKTMAVYVRYNSLYISMASSA